MSGQEITREASRTLALVAHQIQHDCGRYLPPQEHWPALVGTGIGCLLAAALTWRMIQKHPLISALVGLAALAFAGK